MKKYVISLAKDEHRRSLFFAQADTQDFAIFFAINTMSFPVSSLKEQFDDIKFSQYYQREVTQGEIGCVLSHLAVYQKIVEAQQIAEHEYSLICEDDALFCSDFSQTLSSILSTPLNADIVLLGQSKINDFDHVELEINYPTTLTCLQKKRGNYSIGYPYRNYFAGTVAYLIRKSAAQTLLNHAQENRPYWLADDFILYEKQFGLDIQIIRPLLVIENNKVNSNLQKSRGEKSHHFIKKWFKYPLKKLLAIKRNLGK